jgi:predicted phage-related endonuclease
MTVERIPIASREQWKELRRHDVTASVIGTLFGAYPWQTIAGLAAEKMGMEMPGPDPQSSVIRRGNALEPVVAAEVALQRPEWTITKATDYLRDAEARIGATPDFWIEGDPRGKGTLQTKTISSQRFRQEWQGEVIMPPLWIILQAATEAMLHDAAFAAVGVLVIGDYAFDTHVIELPRNRGAEHRLRNAVAEFWAAIEAGEVPQLDYERDRELIKLLWPTETKGKVVDLSADARAAELCEIREEARSLEKAAKERRESAETELLSKIGDAEIALMAGWKASYRSVRVPAQARDPTAYRVLRTTREKA